MKELIERVNAAILQRNAEWTQLYRDGGELRRAHEDVCKHLLEQLQAGQLPSEEDLIFLRIVPDQLASMQNAAAEKYRESEELVELVQDLRKRMQAQKGRIGSPRTEERLSMGVRSRSIGRQEAVTNVAGKFGGRGYSQS